jgi:CRISPR-associated protein Cmr5
MRAEHALKAIRIFRESDQSRTTDTKKPPLYGNLRAYVENLPALIVMNGLGQAMASELAMARIGEESSAAGDQELADLGKALQHLLKGRSGRSADERAHEALYLIVQDWMRECRVCSNKEDLMDALVGGNQKKYVRAQAETLAYLEWLKKFCQAFLRKGGRGEGDEQ